MEDYNNTQIMIPLTLKYPEINPAYLNYPPTYVHTFLENGAVTLKIISTKNTRPIKWESFDEGNPLVIVETVGDKQVDFMYIYRRKDRNLKGNAELSDMVFKSYNKDKSYPSSGYIYDTTMIVKTPKENVFESGLSIDSIEIKIPREHFEEYSTVRQVYYPSH